jgi:hypothetical protein
MLAPSGDLLRAGIALKLNQLKLATRSYLRDRRHQATNAVTSYAVTAGLFAAAGIFLIAAYFVGIMALFRWIEIQYGLFEAYGAVGGLLLLIAAVCAAVAARKLKRPPPRFPSLASRLQGAIKSNPLKREQFGTATEADTAVLSAAPPLAPGIHSKRSRIEDNAVPAALILMATLLGLAAMRRRHQARRMEA